MKKAGLALVVLSFLGGAFFASLDATEMNWFAFVPLMVLGFVGVFLIARVEHALARSDAVVSANRADIEQSLHRIVVGLAELNAKKADIPPYEMRFEIDRQFREDLTRFADARETLGHIYGLRAYAAIMSPFAAGERYLNRVWSTSADGYADEMREYLSRAQEQFLEAQVKLKEAYAGLSA
jgi:hypothetical protein